MKKIIIVLIVVVLVLLLILIQFKKESIEIEPNKGMVLRLTLEINKQDNVNITDMKVDFGYFEKSDNNGEYELHLYSRKEIITKFRFPVYFYLLTNPPMDISLTEKVLFVPYSNHVNLIEVYHKNKIIGTFSVGNLLCNNNGICDGKETYYSCSRDCSTYEKDRVCVPANDGKCDPDCGNRDSDCGIK